MNRFWKLVLAAFLGSLQLVAASHTLGEANDTYPNQQLNYTIAFGPGGGNDLMSRTLVDIINRYDLFEGQNIRVENKPGGSGAVGFSYVARQRGNPYHASSTSGNFIGTPIVANTGWTFKDFTPIGLLAQDAMFIVVRTDSGIDTLEQLVQQAKQRDLKIGGTGATGPERVVAGMLAESADITFTYVPFQNGSGMVTGMTSKSLDAIVANPSEVAGQIRAGNFRALAYSEGQRSTVYPTVPTFLELGYGFSFALPRGVVLPDDIPIHVRDWWVTTLKKVVQTPEWQEYLETKSLSGNTLWGDDFKAYLEKTDSEFRRVLARFGILD